MEYLHKKIKELGLQGIYTYVMDKNPSKYAPYHNNFHLENVCKYALMNAEENGIDLRNQQILATAALFHDFDHSAGVEKDDTINIGRAIEGMKSYICSLPSDEKGNSIFEFDNSEYNIILKLIKATRYPYLTDGTELSDIGKILRDSDILQGLFCQNYINGVTRAIAIEAGIPYESMLKGQANFITNTKYLTKWAEDKANSRIPDVLDLVEIALENYKNY